MKPAETFDPQDVPQGPGVYLFRNALGHVIYVGKAKSLRRRLGSYFQPSRRRTADPKLRALLHSIATYEIQVTGSENEALLLEDRLVKQYTPRYNTDLRDDKRFLVIAVDLAEEYPRLQLARLVKPDGRRYFGPVPHARVLRETVRFLAEAFGLRTCRHARIGPEVHRHCLEKALRCCCAPCLGQVTPADYRVRVEAVLRVLEGHTREIRGALEERMHQAAAARDYETAARCRDMLGNLHSLRRVRAAGTPGSRETPEGGQPLLEQIRQRLGLPALPTTIECFDISNIGGHFAVGSMVRFEHGRPARREYRHFRVRAVQGADDYAMLGEVVARRYRRLAVEQRPMPELVVIDGGPGQLQAARAAMALAGLPPLPMISLAKRLEEIYRPGSVRPLVLARDDGVLRLIQAIRDEAHRFALNYHRLLRQQRIRDSVLDEFPGVGQRRRLELLRRFGSARRLAEATPEAVAAVVPGLGPDRAGELIAFLRQRLARGVAPETPSGGEA